MEGSNILILKILFGEALLYEIIYRILKIQGQKVKRKFDVRM